MSQVASGLRWNLANAVIGQGSNLVRLLLVVAATGPTVAGKYAIALAIVGGAAILTEVGFRQQFISTPLGSEEGLIHRRLSEAWFLNLCLRFVVIGAVLVLVGGNWLLGFAADDTLFAALVLAVASAIAAASNPTLLERERLGDFRPNTLSESGGQLVGLVLVLFLLPAYPSLELLVLSQVAAAAAQVATSYMLVPRHKLARMGVSDLIKMAQAGRPFMLIAIMSYATYSLDKLVLGWLLDANTVGLYYIAQRLAEIPAFAFATVLGRTVLPAYLRTGSGGAGLLFTTVRSYTRILFALFVPGYLVALIILHADWLAALISNWLDARTLLSLLLVAAIFRVGCHLISPAMIIRNDVAIDARFKAQEAALYVPTLVVAVWTFGVIGAATCSIALYSVSWWRRYYFIARYRDCSSPLSS